ncbi:MAG: rhomboid family intramembrane serine protease [Catonella sp.]|uniref:rhomboid family intramembrane serine protease n=1 Tax=Catonella sp. TaxID=2382125 RepID=UPI003FA12465
MITYILIGLNIGIYIVLNMFLLQNGIDIISNFDNSWMAVKWNGEYYRIFTSIFLHADLNHLLNNMLILFTIGKRYESIEGRIRFSFVYFLGGILASIASLSYNMIIGKEIVSLGASGAIFALIGASISSVVKCRNKLRTISKRQIILFAVFSLYAGFANSNTDNIAHLGGLISGFIIGLAITEHSHNQEGTWHEH